MAAVAVHYRLRLPIARIRQYASTDKRGTNVLGLIEAATRLGFQAKGVRGTPDSLDKIPKPAIAHVVIPKPGSTQADPNGPREGLHHYVVIYSTSDKHITLMDPAEGK